MNSKYQSEANNNSSDILKDVIDKEDAGEAYQSLKKDFNDWKRHPFTKKIYKYLSLVKQDNYNAINIATVNGRILYMDKEDVLKFYAINSVITGIEELDADILANYLIKEEGDI